jgi:Xaa-Pro dipeptidase
VNEIAEKTSRLQQMLERESLGGVLLNSQHNFAWLTGGGSNGVDSSRDPGVATLFVRRDGRKFMLANRIEMPRMLAEEISASDFEPVEFPWEDEKSNPNLLNELAKSLLGENQTLGTDLQIGCAQVIEEAIAECRYELMDDELERFRSLGADAGRKLGEVARRVEPGQTESEVAAQMICALSTVNIKPVVILVAADDRIKKFRHPVPKDVAWKKTLMIVACAKRDGLIASLTRIVSAGAVPEELRSRTNATANVNAKLLAATRPGATGSELFDLIARAYASEGFPGEEKLHHQGGACGYRTRDWVAHPASQQIVRDRQAFAWNPSISGTKVEETVIVAGDEIETITASPNWPQISVSIEGKDYRSPDVLTL